MSIEFEELDKAREAADDRAGEKTRSYMAYNSNRVCMHYCKL